MKNKLLIVPLLFLTVIVFGTNLNAQTGNTCGDPIVVSSLPFNDAGNTSSYGDNYGSSDKPTDAPGAIVNGSSSSYLNGDDVVYSYTPANDEELVVSLTGVGSWTGLFAFTGCPFASTVGAHTNSSAGSREIYGLPVTAGETYYFVISTFATPQSTDYEINIYALTNCAGTPTVGAITGPAEACDGKDFTLQGVEDTEVGISYQWEESTDGATWNDISGATDFEYTVVGGISADTYYRLKVTCANGAAFSTSNELFIELTTGVACTCIPTGSSNNSGEIRNFTIANLNNSSAPSEGTAGYSDYTTSVLPATIEIGVAYEPTLTSGTDGGNHGAAIWMDLNDNGIFEASELITSIANSISASSTATFPSFTLPIGTPLGQHTLRVQYVYNQNGADLDPCVVGSSFSETEDYLIDVLPMPDCFQTDGLVATDIGKFDATISWNDSISAPSFIVEYGPAGFTPGSGDSLTVLIDTFTVLSSLISDQDYDYYVSVECSDGSFSTPAKGSFTTLLACPVPTGFSLVEKDGNSVELTWDVAMGGPTAFDIEYGPTGFALGSGTTVGAPPAIITGLSSNTSYDFYVIAQCGAADGESQATNPITVVTDITCPTPTNLAFSNIGQDSVVITWDANSTTDWYIEYDTVGFTQGSSSNPVLNATTNPYDLLGLDTAYTYDVYLWADCGVQGLSDIVGPISFTTLPACPAPSNIVISDIGADTAVVTWDANGTSSWVIEYDTIGSVLGSAGANTFAATASPFTMTGLSPEYNYGIYMWSECGTDGNSDSIGPVNFITQPSCLAPTALSVTNLTQTSAELTWTENGGATSWEVEYGNAGFTQGSGALEVASSNPHAIVIAPDSDNEFYVRSICSAGDTSDWSGPYAFDNIYCIPSNSYSTSYYINDVKTSGAIQNLNNTNTGFTAGGYADYSGTDTLVVYPGQTISVTLVHPSSTHGYNIWVDWDNNFNFTDAGENILSSTYQSAPYIFSLTIPTTATQGVYRMRIRNAFLGNPAPACGSFDYGEAEDYSIAVVSVPSCLPTSDLTSSNPTTTSVDLAWTENNTASVWNVEYGPVGFTPGSGTMISGVTTNPYTVTGLNPSSTYDFYVQSDCGSSDVSANGAPVKGSTDCGVMTAPFYEGFNTGVQPVCWDNLSSNTTSTSINNFWKFTGSVEGGAVNNGKPNGTFAFSDGDTPKPDSMMLITPEIDLSALTTPSLGFEWFSNNTNNPGNNIPMIVSIHDGSSWTLLDTLKGDYAEWQFASFDLAAYNNDTVRIRFMTNQTLITTTAWYNDILIDEIRIDDCVATGGSTSRDVCRTEGAINLNDNIVVQPNSDSKWTVPGFESYLVNDSIFEVSTLAVGAYEAYYLVNYACSDTTTATINVFSVASAGSGSSITVCKNEPINLYAELIGNVDFGGEWYDNDGVLLANSQPKAPNAAGVYNYQYIALNGVCPNDTAVVEVTVDASCDYVSVEEEEFTDISVYPNPASNKLNIINPSNASSLKLEMLDMNGRVVLVENKALNNVSKATIAIDHLERGIYTLRVYNAEGQKTFKVVKQ